MLHPDDRRSAPDAAGSVHHLVSAITEQFEDPHRQSVAAYRREIGQGKTRIRFDRLLQQAKGLVT
ncbi:hypothetical protein [Aminobacter ciceronei]|jgi:hypothetical protein|uniref:hypothetical protein n=1 Tax=Aminobacter ciceronei TaxID=150723 RepID=UPI003F71E0C3